jgi:hypothetical protein
MITGKPGADRGVEELSAAAQSGTGHAVLMDDDEGHTGAKPIEFALRSAVVRHLSSAFS